jgi:hypothetical protein
MKQSKKSKSFRLSVLVQEDDFVKPRWIEVNEINLGSVSKPNNNIKQIRIDPVGEGFADDFMDRLFRGD